MSFFANPVPPRRSFKETSGKVLSYSYTHNREHLGQKAISMEEDNLASVTMKRPVAKKDESHAWQDLLDAPKGKKR